MSSDMYSTQEMARDAKSALTFLKSSIDWIYKLPIDKDAKPVLDRAWTHYSLRLCNASPRTFSEWLLAMREKSLRVHSRHLRFTTTHFDFLLRKLMAYLDGTSVKASPDPKVTTKPHEQHKKTQEKVQSPGVESKRMGTPQQSPAASKSKSKPKGKGKRKADAMDTDSETVTPPTVDPVQSKTSKRKKKKKAQVVPETEGTCPPAADDSASEEPTPVIKEVEQTEDVTETSSVTTESTWHTMRDSPHAYGITRAKRAVARILLKDRTCSCQNFTRATVSPEFLHFLCNSVVETIPAHLLEPMGIYAIGRSEYVTTLLSTFNSLDPLGCRICSVAVGSGLGIFLWVLAGT